MNEEVYKNIMLALQVTHSSSSSQTERENAYSYLESFKKQSDSINYGIYIFTNQNEDQHKSDVVRQFSLHVINNYIKNTWNQLDLARQVELRGKMLEMLSSSMNNLLVEPIFIKEKMVKIISEIAKRQFPQRWQTLLPNMMEIFKLGDTQVELVMLVFRSLAEDCVSSTFNSSIPPARRKDILQGMNTIFTDFLPIVYSTLESHYGRYTSLSSTMEEKKSSEMLLISTLGMMKEFIDWCPIPSLIDSNYNFVLVFVSLISINRDATTDYGVSNAALECLEALSHRYIGKNQKDIIFQVTQIYVEHLNMIPIGLENQRLVNEKKLIYHHNVNQSMVGWGNHQIEPFLNVWLDENPEVLFKFLQCMSCWFDHPNLTVVESQVTFWFGMTRHKKLVDQEFTKQYIFPQLWKVVSTRYFKLGSPESNQETPISECSVFEFEDHDRFIHFIGNLRGKLVVILRNLVEYEPQVGVQICTTRLAEILQNYSRGTDDLSSNDYCTETSTAYIYLEGITCFIDAILKYVPDEKVVDSSTDIRVNMEKMIELLLSYQTMDPLLCLRQLAALAAFTSYYKHFPSKVLPLVLEKLFSSITFCLPNESLSNASVEVLNTRNRAIISLVLICNQIPSQMLPCFPDLCSRVVSLIQQNLILSSEMVLLYEMLVVVSNSMANCSEQKSFLDQVVQEPLTQWTSPALTQIISSVENLVREIHGHEAGNSVQTVSGNTLFTLDHLQRNISPSMTPILRCLTILYGVAKRVKSSSFSTGFNSSEDPFGHNWNHILPNLFSFISTLHSLYEPETRMYITNSFATSAGFMYSLSYEELIQMFGGREQVEEALLQDRTVQCLKWSKWHKNARDISYHLLGTALTQPQFYMNENALHFFGTTIVGKIRTMEHRHVRLIFTNIILIFLKNVPISDPRMYSLKVEPILNATLEHMLHRLSLSWMEIMNKTNAQERAQMEESTKFWKAVAQDIDSTKQEVVQEKTLIDVTRSSVEFLETLINPKTVVEGSSGAKHILIEKDRILRDIVLFSNPNVNSSSTIYVICMILNGGICWPSSQICRRSLLLMDHLIDLVGSDIVADKEKYFDLFGREVFHAALFVLMEQMEHTLEDNIIWDIIQVVKNIYCRFTLEYDCPFPRQILMTLPTVTESQIRDLEAVVKKNGSAKGQKNAIKEFLEVPIKAYRSGSSNEAGNSGNVIQNLPEKLMLASKMIKEMKQKENNLDLGTSGLFQA